MPTTNPTNPTARGERVEGLVLVLIVIAVGLAAGAASFTHVHDWTMANSPTNTPGWFGWANAVISELVPIGSLLTIRRRKRTGDPIGYPMSLLIAAGALSLAAQLGVAVEDVGPSGWLLSAVPALAFMALVKLVLTPVTTTHDTDTSTVEPTRTSPTATPDTEPATLDGEPVAPLAVPAHLISTARFAAVSHEQAIGRPITAAELATRMSIPTAVAGQLLTAITEPTPAPIGPINGAVVGGVR